MSHKHDEKDLSRLRSLSPGVRVNSRYINSTTGTSSTLERRSARISSSLDGLLNSTPATSLVFCPGRALHLLTTHVRSLREKKRGRQRDRQEERERERQRQRQRDRGRQTDRQRNRETACTPARSLALALVASNCHKPEPRGSRKMLGLLPAVAIFMT